MAKINVPISPANFEIIRDRIAVILADEFQNQFFLQYDPNIDPVIYVERSNSFDKRELPAGNVSYAVGNFGNKNQGSTDSTHQFNVDFYSSAKTTNAEGGDVISAKQLHRLIAMARYIIDDPIYKTLGFKPGFILRVSCSEILIKQPDKEDATNSIMGRLIVTVVANESNKLITPELALGYDTQVRIDVTDEGYFYATNNYY